VEHAGTATVVLEVETVVPVGTQPRKQRGVNGKKVELNE